MKYYLYRRGRKSKALSHDELKQKNLKKSDRIWREDKTEWLNASDFDELTDLIEPTPPDTPLDSRLKYTFVKSKNFGLTLAIIYIPMALILGLTSANFEFNEYEEYINGVEPSSRNKTSSLKLYASVVGKSNNKINGQLLSDLEFPENDEDELISEPTDFLNNLVPDDYDPEVSRVLETFSFKQAYIWKNGEYYCRYPTFLPSRNNETYHYERTHKLFLRPFRTYFTEVYLSSKEQTSKAELVRNMIWASFVNLLWIFVSILSLYAIISFFAYPTAKHTSTISHS